MRPNKPIKTLRFAVYISICAALTGVGGCGTTPDQPPTVDTAPLSPGKIQSQDNTTLSSRQQVEYEMGLDLLDQKKYKKAQKILASFAKNGTAPADVKANFALANYYLENYKDAQKSIGKAILQQPNKADYYNIAGLIAMDSAHYKEAEQFFKQALTLNGEHPLAHYNLALLYDIYYQEIKLAYNHYLKYLNLVNYEDKETVQWVEQLSYSVEAN